ncbi:hypothetical protein GPECTOR_42g763 [Gonium pectorale]|uniref:Uncharacterized protein n=1 Tax=Gonium pectorale TaxID=33097 RepID=A0A150GAG2_GONPE|nr:hypothetical protein GPECTOR_42g763 [Gonium pectorale]|eukprot:KXZ46555.1 hypothetical protein GPECTOR_42g763 [Gonium pectorale]
MATELRGLLKLVREKLNRETFEKLKGCVTAAAEAVAEALNRMSRKNGALAERVVNKDTSFLYGRSCRPVSLCDLKETMEDDDFDKKTVAKWQKVVAYAHQQGVSIGRLAAASAPLRQQRFDQACATDETPDQLREWAGKSLQGNVDKLLKFLTHLTLPQQPLVPRPGVAAVFDNASA